jgi:hypothetical protein
MEGEEMEQQAFLGQWVSVGRCVGEQQDCSGSCRTAGREAQLRMSGARADTITDITSHTSEQGRAAYTWQEMADVLAANHGADEAVVHAVERLPMGADGAVLMAANGAAVTPTAQPAPTGAAAAAGGATPGPKLWQSSMYKWAAVPTKPKKDEDL